MSYAQASYAPIPDGAPYRRLTDDLNILRGAGFATSTKLCFSLHPPATMSTPQRVQTLATETDSDGCAADLPALKIAESVECEPASPRPPVRDVREQFQAISTNYKLRRYIFIIIIAPLSLSFMISMLFLHDKVCECITGIATITAAFIFELFMPTLFCPGCNEHLDKRLGVCCPECGTANIKSEYWSWKRFCHLPPQCSNCKKKLIKGIRSRRYVICYCTHCGAHVDDQGM